MTSLRPSSDVPSVFLPQATRAATRQDFVEIARAKERGQHHRLRPSPPSRDGEHHAEHHASEAISCYNITPIQMASGQRSQWSQNTHRHSILGHSSSAERRERGREGESTQSSLQRVTVDADRWWGHRRASVTISGGARSEGTHQDGCGEGGGKGGGKGGESPKIHKT